MRQHHRLVLEHARAHPARVHGLGVAVFGRQVAAQVVALAEALAAQRAREAVDAVVLGLDVALEARARRERLGAALAPHAPRHRTLQPEGQGVGGGHAQRAYRLQK